MDKRSAISSAGMLPEINHDPSPRRTASGSTQPSSVRKAPVIASRMSAFVTIPSAAGGDDSEFRQRKEAVEKDERDDDRQFDVKHCPNNNMIRLGGANLGRLARIDDR
jgi:hypothetical protein